ncbi:MAG: hypothetical protein NTZ05_05125, partial [Chloroflexi bacterium]|nr:hypothetical protein [Chloroflexota bacterium]
QAAAAAAAVMLVAALFVLAGLPYDDRILVLAGVWGSFPGAGIGLLMGLGGSRRSPELSPRSQPTLAAPRLATPVFGANAVLGDGAAVRRLPPVPPPPHVAAASEPLRFAPPEPPRGAAMSGVLLRLDREVTALRAQNIEARLLALDGAQSGVACAVVRLRSALGDVYTLYLTCDAAYPTTAPSLTVSRSDAQSGIEQEVAFTSQVVSQWRVGGSAGEVVMEFARRVGIR